MSAATGLSKGLTALHSMNTFNNVVGTARVTCKWVACAGLVSTLALKIYTFKVDIEKGGLLKPLPADLRWDQRALSISLVVFVASTFIYLVSVPTQMINHYIITRLEG